MKRSKLDYSDWLWRFKVGYSSNDVLVNTLTKENRKGFCVQYKKIVDEFSNYIFVDSLIDSVVEEEITSFKYLEDLFKTKNDRIVSVEMDYKLRLENKLDKVSKEMREICLRFIEAAIESDLKCDEHFLMKLSLPENFLSKFKNIQKNERIVINYKEDRILSDIEIEEFVLNFISKRDIKNLVVDFESLESGWAEYWPAHLNGGAKDTLKINKRIGLYTHRNLLDTLKHELFPGHGLFYRSKSRDSFFDDGSSLCIEGWATYCELFDLTKNEAEKLIGSWRTTVFMWLNYDRDSKDYLEYLEQQGYGEAQIKDSALMNSQMPTYSISYVLGALILLNKYGLPENLKKIKDSLREISCDDFFWRYS